MIRPSLVLLPIAVTIGFVYAAVNVGFPGRVKIGWTRVQASRRIKQLQRHYGTHHPFTERFKLMVPNPSRVEALAHRRLAHCRDWGTELFFCSSADAMEAIRWAADEALKYPNAPRPERSQRWRRARRYTYQNWMLTTCLSVIGISLIIWLAQAKPDVPGWLPGLLERTASLIERLPMPSWLNL